MKTKLIFAALAAFAFFGTVSCAGSGKGDGDAHKIAIACHRGYWKCDEAGQAQNSIAALRVAQEYGFWGSEFDLHLCTDEVIPVYHDNKLDGKRIDACTYSEVFGKFTLPNGEKVPTFEEYLEQGAKDPKCVLVCEFKVHPTPEQEDRLIELSVEKMKAAGMYDPERIIFISFSKHVCDVIAETMPEFTNQYLGGDISPEDLAKDGINGIDYEYDVLVEHPEWVAEAHNLGMSVNVWTVNKREKIEKMVDLGVDCITTNQPERVRTILEEKSVEEL